MNVQMIVMFILKKKYSQSNTNNGALMFNASCNLGISNSSIALGQLKSPEKITLNIQKLGKNHMKAILVIQKRFILIHQHSSVYSCRLGTST